MTSFSVQLTGVRPLMTVAALISLIYLGPAESGPLDPPAPDSLRQAQTIVREMQASERGPYTRIRWFCNDGTVQPPVAFACKERGGGRQHAEYSPARQRLGELGWHVGTIFAALDWKSLWQDEARHLRLRELPLERYFIDVDDGWVLRRAQYYRGRVQVEDEERSGRDLLLKLMAQVNWISEHFLVAAEVVRAVPHGTGEDLTRAIRRTAQQISEKDRSFERLRVETHSSPTSTTAGRVRAWISAGQRNPELIKEATTLASELDRLFGAAGRAERLAAARKRLSRYTLAASVVQQLKQADAKGGLGTLERLSAVMYSARQLITDRSAAPALRLELFDLLKELEAELRVLSGDLVVAGTLTRAELAHVATALAKAAFGTGLFSPGELGALSNALAPLRGKETFTLHEYSRATRVLSLASTWAVGSVRYAFADILVRYAALEPRAAYFVDDLLRGSVLLPLAGISGRLSTDAQRLAGVRRQLFGSAASDLIALNPGLARGRLRVLSEKDMATDPMPVKREDIVVLPESTAELPPVAGVMTVGESNPLSHIQLLARNFGIPNLSITPALFRILKEHDGKRVLVAAGSDGSVLIADDEANAKATAGQREAQAEKLEVPQPDLSFRQPIPLEALNRSLSGRRVGPKAANLGELSRLFPGRVAAAIALPFGVFDQQTSAGDDSPRARLNRAYQAARDGRLSTEALTKELESIRQAITSLKIVKPLRSELSNMMAQEFGPPGGYGVFIRSDTNVEDLPGFTGAGLSLTLPNVVGLDAQLDAIPQVWASVLSPRAIAWRSNLLKRPEMVYSSVLLMKSVPSDKSGVLVTTDVSQRTAGLTVTTAWGVGGGVAGETTESLVLRPDGTEALLSEAKSPYRRELDPQGGTRWRPASDGPVLTAAEKGQLRALAKEVDKKAVPAIGPDGKKLPWDIEFGFVGGELTLFQIRPLIERGPARADSLLSSFLPTRTNPEARVDLQKPPD